MSHNMSIYKRPNPRLLVQAGLGLDLLYWANMSNMYVSNRKKGVVCWLRSFFKVLQSFKILSI